MTATMSKPQPRLSTEQIQDAVNAILDALGDPWTPEQSDAITFFRAGKYETVRDLATYQLDDNYIKALGYLASAHKNPPTIMTLLAESARSAAEAQKQRTLSALSIELKQITQIQ